MVPRFGAKSPGDGTDASQPWTGFHSTIASKAKWPCAEATPKSIPASTRAPTMNALDVNATYASARRVSKIGGDMSTVIRLSLARAPGGLKRG